MSNREHPLRSITFALLVCGPIGGCGDQRAINQGVSDPCDLPAGPVLGCSAAERIRRQQQFGLVEACERLVSCNVLSSEQFVASGSDCEIDDDCSPGQQCLAQGERLRCHSRWLDRGWCIARFGNPPDDPCDSSRGYSRNEIDAMIRCVQETPCASLGLPRDQKSLSSEERPERDQYTCPDGTTSVSTATVCDNGLLNYAVDR